MNKKAFTVIASIVALAAAAAGVAVLIYRYLVRNQLERAFIECDCCADCSDHYDDEEGC